MNVQSEVAAQFNRSNALEIGAPLQNKSSAHRRYYRLCAEETVFDLSDYSAEGVARWHVRSTSAS